MATLTDVQARLLAAIPTTKPGYSGDHTHEVLNRAGFMDRQSNAPYIRSLNKLKGMGLVRGGTLTDRWERTDLGDQMIARHALLTDNTPDAELTPEGWVARPPDPGVR